MLSHLELFFHSLLVCITLFPILSFFQFLLNVDYFLLHFFQNVISKNQFVHSVILANGSYIFNHTVPQKDSSSLTLNTHFCRKTPLMVGILPISLVSA